jgi:thiosulfate/3-mercaptopyruvate sulfurtransferase
MSSFPRPLVSTEWLASHLEDADLVVVDSSWYLAAMQRDAKAEYREHHIPGAVFWDLDLLSDQRTPLPHMLPDPETFAREVGNLGIADRDRIVVYDGSGANLSAPRVWWMFRVHGHDEVAVLDGGMGKWLAEGRRVESGLVSRPGRTFVARFRPELVRSLAQVEASVGRPDVQLLDARSPGRFIGAEPEPRPGLRSGHIPGAKNLPYGELVAPDGTLLPPEELARKFRAAGIDLDRPVVTSCGSGVSACALALGLEAAGHQRYAVYDGSWAEWGLEAAKRPVA